MYRMKKAVMRAEAVLLLAFVMVVCICLAIYAKPAQAQEAELGVYQQNLIDHGELTPRVFLEGYSFFTERAGFWGWCYGEKQYASCVAGPFYRVPFAGEDGYWEFGGAIGTEMFPGDTGSYHAYWRGAAYASFAYKKFFTQYYREKGESEHWVRTLADYQFLDHLAVGAIHQTGDGVGPRIILSFGKKVPVNIWLGYMFRVPNLDDEGHHEAVLLNFEFFVRR